MDDKRLEMMDDCGAVVVSAGGETKREYRAPRLIELGALRDITLAVGMSGQKDGVGGKWKTGF